MLGPHKACDHCHNSNGHPYLSIRDFWRQEVFNGPQPADVCRDVQERIDERQLGGVDSCFIAKHV